MVISQPGLICLEATRDRLVRGFLALWFGADNAGPEPVPAVAVGSVDLSVGAAAGVAEDDNEAALPELPPAAEAAPLTARERRARAAALRGLLLARQRRFAAAQSAFAEAARLDPDLDLANVPTFWDLERAGHEAAVRAYEEAGRGREASLLASRLRSTFRPRLVPARSGSPTPVG